MKNLFKDQQILPIIIGGVAATIITAWIFNPQSGPVGTMVTVTVSGFPLNTDIVITFNGKKVATIPKGMDMGTFIVPQSSPPFSYEVRAAGGDPLTFGYAWFRVTKM